MQGIFVIHKTVFSHSNLSHRARKFKTQSCYPFFFSWNHFLFSWNHLRTINSNSKERVHHMIITSTKQMTSFSQHFYFANKSTLQAFLTFVAANTCAKTSTNCQVSHRWLSQTNNFHLIHNLFKFIGFGFIQKTKERDSALKHICNISSWYLLF